MQTQLVDVAQDEVSTLLRALAEQSEEYAFVFMNAKGEFLWWNDAAQTLFGLTLDQVIGKHSSLIFTSEDRLRGIPQLEMSIALSDALAQDDRWHARADGSRFWSSGAMVALRNARGELIGFGKLVRDRTKLKEQLELFREEARVAREMENNQKVGIATLAHEMRNVLAVFTHGIKLLRDEGATAERRQQLLDLMDEQTVLVNRLTEDLLDISRIGVGKLQLQVSEVILQEILEHTLAGASRRANDKSIQLQLLMPPAPIKIKGDLARLSQVVGNLLDNAIKYTPSGGRVWVKLTTEDPEAVIHVQDEGIGIPADMLSKIFDLFTQVETPASRHGLGIGLALVKELVALHGGSVQARSSGEGKGSEFTVRLPM